jgi:glycosyltransferase involved in cell wall biosynthesis
MRILNVTQTYAPFYEFGGPPVKVQALSEGLARRGHTVTVLTADWGLEKRIQGLQAENGHSDAGESPFGKCMEETGVQAIYLPTWLRYRATSWNPAVKRFCRTRLQDFDVAHIYGLYDLLGPIVAAACRVRKLPYIVEPIGMFVPIVRSLPLKRMYHTVFGRRLFAGARAVIATSEQEAAELSRGGISHGKIVLRRNGVEPPARFPARGAFRASRGIPLDAKVVLFLGRLSEKKSPDLLLKAFAMLPAQINGRSLHLVIAGPDEGGMRKRLKQMAEQAGLGNRVQICGSLFGEEKWAAYMDADVFVLPSVNENFGNTAAEAAAAGTPVMVTHGCGIAPLLADVAGLVVAHDAVEVSQALARILGNEELHDRLAAGCKDITAGLGWEEPVRQMEELYGKLGASQSVATNL